MAEKNNELEALKKLYREDFNVEFGETPSIQAFDK